MQNDERLETKYGLPAEVTFCKTCVISNQRPNSAVEFSHTISSHKKTIHFDEQGVCDACRVAEMKNKVVHWAEREKELIELCNQHRKNDGSFDCIVPGSGGKDSFYAAHLLKNKYGMHPLTITWAPHLYTDWGWKNFQSWIHAGFDNMLFTPNGKTHRLLTRLAVDKLFHPFQPFIIGQKLLATRMALQLNIPLVFYGENEAEYGNPKEDAFHAQRNSDYAAPSKSDEIYLSGTNLDELKKRYQLPLQELQPYLPTNPDDVRKKHIVVHYLGYYLPWHPQEAYYYSVEHGNFQASPERTVGTFSKYNSIDDKIDDFHYYTTYVKFGIGRATYDAAQEIRAGEINREEGVALVKKFDGEWPERFAKEIFEYLSIDEKTFGAIASEFVSPMMSKESFMHLAKNFYSPHLWQETQDGFKLRHQVS